MVLVQNKYCLCSVVRRMGVPTQPRFFFPAHVGALRSHFSLPESNISQIKSLPVWCSVRKKERRSSPHFRLAQPKERIDWQPNIKLDSRHVATPRVKHSTEAGKPNNAERHRPAMASAAATTGGTHSSKIPDSPAGPDGRPVPAVAEDVIRAAVLDALEIDYRHLDTAAAYGSERAVAEAARCGVMASREEVFVTTKVWCTQCHPELVIPSLRESLQ
jgi:hypothetical protein